MARFGYPYRAADMKFGSNLIENFIVLCIGVAITTAYIFITLCKIIVLVFTEGSNNFISRYNSLKSFYPLFCKIAIITILLQVISLILYIYLHKMLNIYTPLCLILIFLSCILTASVNGINSPNEKTMRKKMYIYCWGVNASLLIFNVLPYLPYFYYNTSFYDTSFVYYIVEESALWNYFTITFLSVTHIILFIMGRFYKTLFK